MTIGADSRGLVVGGKAMNGTPAAWPTMGDCSDMRVCSSPDDPACVAGDVWGGAPGPPDQSASGCSQAMSAFVALDRP